MTRCVCGRTCPACSKRKKNKAIARVGKRLAIEKLREWREHRLKAKSSDIIKE
jgi:hypothetical protein